MRQNSAMRLCFKGGFSSSWFPVPKEGRQGLSQLLGKDNVLMQAPSQGLCWRWSVTRVPTVRAVFVTVFTERRERWTIFCNSFPFQHIERKNESKPKRGSPGLSSALPYVTFNFPEDIRVGQGIMEAKHCNSGCEMQLRSYNQPFTVMLRLVKVSSHSGRTQSSEYISTKQDLFWKETPRLLWWCFSAAVHGFGHNSIVTITINHIPAKHQGRFSWTD